MLRWIAIGALVLGVAFSIRLFFLYRQIGEAFRNVSQFIPTRFYSDVTRIAPPMTRGQIETRLKALAYTTTRKDNSLVFTLHSIDYPLYLLPDGHLTEKAAGHSVELAFDTDDTDAPLVAIRAEIDGGSQELTDLFLEPETLATLSRGTPGGPQEIRKLVQFEDIPAPIWQAILSVEDQHFLDHKGLDPRGIARAIWVDLRTLSFSQGGSTITAQLVKNLSQRRSRNIVRKFSELFLALMLEMQFSKEEILGRYLNEVYLGQVGAYEVHGVAEGAKHFFNKEMSELNLGEIALMAGLIKGPGYYSPYRFRERAMERQRLVLKKMVEEGFIAEAESREAAKMPIRLAPPVSATNKAPYFADFVKAEILRELKDRVTEETIADAGYRVYTTLDPQANQIAQTAVNQGIRDLETRLKTEERLEGALAAVDHTNGHIRALVGGRSYAESTFNRILNMRRQVGSTFKPIVYLTALLQGRDANGVSYGPGYPMEDAPWKLIYDGGRQTWIPKNYEKEFEGWVPLRTALAKSINTVAAKLGMQVGLDKIISTARSLGIQSELPAVPSLALGVAELSPVELLRVYATIANHGIQDELTVIRAITQDDGTNVARYVYHPTAVISQPAADLLTNMLQSTFLEGTAMQASAMGLDRPAAGKTGTTSQHRDAWFAGYTPQLTTVVWVGADNTKAEPAVTDPKAKKSTKKPMQLTGAGSALPIWVRFMKDALHSEPPVEFALSSEITDVKIDRLSGQEAFRDCPDDQTKVEKYISEFAPSHKTCESSWPASQPELKAN